MPQVEITGFDTALDFNSAKFGGATSGYAYVFNENTFTTAEGVAVLASHWQEGASVAIADFYKKTSWTLNLTTGQITVGAFTIAGNNALYATVDVNGINQSVYTLALFTVNGRHIETIYSGIPIASVPTSTNWKALFIASVIGRPLLPRAEFYTKTDIDNLLAELSSLSLAGIVPFYGGAALSKAPASALSPIAVGDNDPRAISISTYGNSLAAAITGIGAVPTTLIIGENITVSTALTIPATLILELRNGAKITKSGSGSLTFQGIGITNPWSRLPLFSGFAAGDITWTGAVYPIEISTDTINSPTSVTEAYKVLDAAFTGKQVTILLSPGAITTQAIVRQYHTARFLEGVFTNTATVAPQFVLYNDTRAVGAGMTRTVINESAVATHSGIFYSSSLTVLLTEGANRNIEVSDMFIQGGSRAGLDQANSSVEIGNCYNGHIRNIWFKQSAGFAATFAGFGTAGNYNEGCSITYCVFDDVWTQNCNILNGQDCIIGSCIFINIGLTGSGNLTVIDCEPNDPADRLVGVQVIDNIIDARGGAGTHLAIAVQDSQSQNVRNNRVAGNIIIGGDAGDPSPTKHLYTGIAAIGQDSCTVENNFISFTTQAAVSVRNCIRTTPRNNTIHNAGAESSLTAFNVICTLQSDIAENIIKQTSSLGSQDSTIAESESTVTVNVTALNPDVLVRTGGETVHYWWIGQLFTIGGTDYTVASIDPVNNKFTVTAPVAGVPLTGVTATTKFCGSNTYKDNECDAITLSALGTSKVIADGASMGTAITPAQITSNQNNYNPAPSRGKYKLIRLSTDASRNITGLKWTKSYGASSTDSPPQDGDQHRIVNVGIFNIVLVNQSASSTALNRFLTDTGSDITLVPKEEADLVYDGTTARYRAAKLGGAITAGELPTGIDAIKIGAGNVSNTEYGYLDGVTATLQTQLDALATLIGLKSNTASPTFTGTVTIPTAVISTSLAVGGGTAITKVVKGTVTVNPASINATTFSSQTFTLTGAITGDVLILNPPAAGLDAGILVVQSFVSNTNQITICFYNSTGGSIDIASADWTYTLIRS